MEVRFLLLFASCWPDQAIYADIGDNDRPADSLWTKDEVCQNGLSRTGKVDRAIAGRYSVIAADIGR